jgi:hypothetical protein
MIEQIKLRLSKDTIHFLRESFEDIKERARAIYAIDFLSFVKNSSKTSSEKITYENKKGILSALRTRLSTSVNGQKDPTKDILQKLHSLGIIVLLKDDLNEYGKPVWEMHVEQNFQDYSWYSFTEEDPEFSFLKKLKEKNLQKRQNRHKDASIKISEKYIEDLGKVAPTLAEIMIQRNEGKEIPTETSIGRTGRIYTTYTNLPKKFRKLLTDSSGNTLQEIDIASSQCSFLLGFLRNLKTLSKENVIELEKLEHIQKEYSWHTYFSEVLKNQGINISRDLMKPLIFKFIFGDFNQHEKAFLKKETEEALKESNLNPKETWNAVIQHFQESFPTIYNLLKNLSFSFKLKNTTKNLHKLSTNTTPQQIHQKITNKIIKKYIWIPHSIKIKHKKLSIIPTIPNTHTKNPIA